MSEAEIHKDGKVVSKSKGQGSKQSRTDAHTEAKGEGGGESVANNTAETKTAGRAEGLSGGKGGAKNQSRSVTYKETFIPDIETEREENGQLKEGPIADQKEKMKQQLHVLAVRLAIIASRSCPRAFVARIAEVKEWFESSSDKMKAISRIREALHRLRSYHFDPGAGVQPTQ